MMFSKKAHVDVKKSFQKVLETKKDSPSRLKHLRVLLEYLDSNESKNFFEHHYSHVYYIFFDTLSSLEGSFRLKAVQKSQNKEELDSLLYIFEKILVLLPELIRRRWQFHSIGIVLRKLLHPHNSVKVRQEGVRLFILWYQILGDSATSELQPLFEALVPGIVPQHSSSIIFPLYSDVQSNQVSHFYSDQGIVGAEGNLVTSASVMPVDIEPLVPSMPGDYQPKDPTCHYLQCVMDNMVTQVAKIQWREQKDTMQFSCFQYLFEQFRKTYVRNIFTNLNESHSLYKETFELPSLRPVESYEHNDTSSVIWRESLANSKALVIRWFAKYLSNDNEIGTRRVGSFGDLTASKLPLPTGALETIILMQPSFANRHHLNWMPFAVQLTPTALMSIW
ncbi:Ral GTPase-activating protein subunit alpha-1 [Halotydeus destructor]|nr:Ral GTPase-activating protein subunit alpha-1 [Halotydeus destructor]